MMGNKNLSREVMELHNQIIIADGHCDTILELLRSNRRLASPSMKGHVDLERLKKGNVRVQFFAAFIETIYKPYNSLGRVLELIDKFYQEVELCQEFISPCSTTKKIKKDLDEGKIIAVLGIEGGEALNGSLAVLRMLYRLGVRFIGLTWNQRNQLADGVGERLTGGGLTSFGFEVIKEMNELGMIIDLSHISEKGFWDVLKHSNAPVMVSHTNCYELCSHPRNLADKQIKALADQGGIMGLSFVPEFLGGENPGLEEFMNHLDHVAGLVGTDIIALGSDFDGIDKTPRGLEDCRCYPVITGKLMDRGYTKREIRGIMGENMLRFMEKIL
ncbi:MAG TPA: dipeptidase [Desulfobacteria bacterium]|nr:dipeptidase [Desulfobacteria bacterium]